MNKEYSILLNIPIRKGIYLYTFSILKKKSSLFNITFKFIKTNLYPDKVFCEDCKYYDGICYHSSNLIILKKDFYELQFKNRETCWDINRFNNCSNFKKGKFLVDYDHYCCGCKYYKNENCYHKSNRKYGLIENPRKPEFGEYFVSTPNIINKNNNCEYFRKEMERTTKNLILAWSCIIIIISFLLLFQ